LTEKFWAVKTSREVVAEDEVMVSIEDNEN
jgi:hypothetical protein